MPELFITNFNRNFTGVSATAATVIRQQVKDFDLRLVGRPLPGCPDPITLRAARRLCKSPPSGRAVSIWHVRRNTEMRAALWARDVLGLPIRIVFTSAAQRRHSAFPRWLISRMDAVIATTDTAASFVPHVRATAPHGVDTDRFTPTTDRSLAWSALGYPGSQGIASIGRIRPEKGTDLFVRTMIELLPQIPGLTALVIGRAATEHQGFLNALRGWVDQAGLSDRILFPGEIAPDALPSLLQGLSLVMQLPRYEGFGMVPLEAMASGVPFVGSDAGYYRVFSSGERAGFIVPHDSPDQAANAALRILSDGALHMKMSQDAHDLAQTSFGAAQEAATINRVYAEIWAETSTP